MTTESLNQKRKQFHSDSLDAFRSCITAINKYCTDEKEDLLEKLKISAKECSEIDNDFLRSRAALRETRNYFSSGENLQYKENVEDIFQSKLKDVDVAECDEQEAWNDILTSIKNAVVDPNPLNDSSMNSSVVCSQSFRIPLDPLTKKPIENPCKNRICGHIYDYDSITSYVKSKIRACPYIGCVNRQVSAKHLEIDHSLKNTIDKMAERQHESDSD